MREAAKVEANSVVRFGHYRLDRPAGRLWRKSHEVKLPPKAFETLRYFVERPGQLITKNDLLTAIWAPAVVGDATLASCIQALRQALRDNAKNPRYIETVPRRGYRFIENVVSHQHTVASNKEEARGWRLEASFPSPPVSSLKPLASPIVGRETALAQLHRWLDKAMSGERQVVFISGEAGIGKTTFVEVFLSEVRGPKSELTPNPPPLSPGVWVGEGQCIEHYGAGEPYLPLLEALGRLCRQPDGEQVVAVLAQYAPTWLVQMPAVISAEECEVLRRKTGDTTQERMLRELAEAVEVLTAERPLVLWLEDLHWADVATLDWLALLARRRERAKLMVLGSYRLAEVSVTDHPLRAVKQELQLHGYCEELPLTFLTEAQVAEYVSRRFAVDAQYVAPLQELASAIHRRTEGNPLFMVNMIEALIAQHVLSMTEGRWIITEHAELAMTGIPVSLRQLIEQQYERLPPEAQQVLAVASVAGVEFSAATVAASRTITLDTVEEQCDALVRRAHFLRLSGTQQWPDGTVATRYHFLHALYQEVMYEQLSAGRRQRLHQQLGERIEQGYGGHAREVAAELAMHFERGRVYAKAIQYHHQAGENAAQRSAQTEAIEHFSTGLVLLKNLPDAPERTQQELTLQMNLGELLTTVKGFGVPEVAHAFTRARELCRQLGETPQLFRSLLGLWTFYVERAELATAHDLAARLLRLAEDVQSAPVLVWAHLSLGITLHFQGDQVSARHHLEQSLAFYDPPHFRALSAQYDPSVLSLSTLGPVLWLLGYPEQGQQRSQEALTLARALPQPYNLAYALNLASRVYWLRGEQQAVQEIQNELTAFSSDQGFVSYLALSKVLGGWVVAEQGRLEEGIYQMQQNLQAWRATGAESARPYYLALLAEAYAKAGQPEEGGKVSAEGTADGERTGGRFFMAELYRLRGELTRQRFHVSRSRFQVDKGPQPILSRVEGSKVQGSLMSGVQRLASDTPNTQHLTPCTQAEAQAEACFLKALEIARTQHVKSLELRATMSLVRLRQQQSSQLRAPSPEEGTGAKRVEDHRLLSDIYNWFSEGFTTTDLQAAKALLTDLA